MVVLTQRTERADGAPSTGGSKGQRSVADGGSVVGVSRECHDDGSWRFHWFNWFRRVREDEIEEPHRLPHARVSAHTSVLCRLLAHRCSAAALFALSCSLLHGNDLAVHSDRCWQSRGADACAASFSQRVEASLDLPMLTDYRSLEQEDEPLRCICRWQLG